MDVALVQDHLVQRGGGERVLLSMCRALPSAPVYTAFYWPEACYPEFTYVDVRPLPIDRVPGLRKRHRMSLPLLPLAFDRLRVDAEVVVCGTSGWAAGARTEGRKILYFHSLARWIHERETYLAGRGLVEAAGLASMSSVLRRWDERAVRSGDRHLVYSSAMADQVRAVYGIEADVLPPPVTVDPHGFAAAPADLESGFVLCPCRLMAYKNVDVVIEAFAQRPGDRLVVAGGGPEEERLRAMAPKNVTLVGQVDDPAMRWLYANSRAIITAAFEPFGLVTLEGNAFGRPAIALRHGGFRDTVIEGETGIFFDELTPAAVAAAVDEVDNIDFDPSVLEAHAELWSEDAFVARLQRIVAEETALV